MLRKIEKYVDKEWIQTRMRFVRKDNIIRVDDVVYVVDEDPKWNTEDQTHSLVVHKYNLKADFEMSDDKTFVIIRDHKK